MSDLRLVSLDIILNRHGLPNDLGELHKEANHCYHHQNYNTNHWRIRQEDLNHHHHQKKKKMNLSNNPDDVDDDDGSLCNSCHQNYYLLLLMLLLPVNLELQLMFEAMSSKPL